MLGVCFGLDCVACWVLCARWFAFGLVVCYAGLDLVLNFCFDGLVCDTWIGCDISDLVDLLGCFAWSLMLRV